jgi:two-component sensor histidine kinase
MASLGRDGDLKVAEHMGGLARALITTSALPLLLLDGDRRVVSASRSFCSAFDILTDGVDGLRVDELGGGAWNIPELNGLLEAAIAGQGDAGPFETDLLRPDYPPRRLVMHVQKVDYDGGADVRVLMAIDDVTETRSADSQIATLMIEKDGLLRERAVLLQEMQHRIANSLQIIAGILLMKARNVSSEESRRHLQDAHDRVMSVAAVQEHLQTSVGDVEMCPYLEKLAESLAASMIREARGLALVVRCDPLAVSSQEAVSIGLIVTELVINALKHAFPDERMGQVIIDYALTPLGWTLSVSDDGVGRPDPSTIRSGLGSSVIEALAQQLGAKVVADDTPPGARISVVNTDAGGAAA